MKTDFQTDTRSSTRALGLALALVLALLVSSSQAADYYAIVDNFGKKPRNAFMDVSVDTTIGAGSAGPDGFRRETPGMPGVWGGSRLAAESEPSDDGAVARVVLLDQISKKATALAHELEEAAAGVIVLWKALEMVRQALDSLCQERDLDFRGSRVTLLGGEL